VTTDTPRLYVLDTNVLLHDPTALFKFHEHDLYLPMGVLEELDGAKKGVSELARNARQVSRFLDEIIGSADKLGIEQGLPLPMPGNGKTQLLPSGKLFLQTETLPQELPVALPGTKTDTLILSVTLALQKQRSDRLVIVVSKDINLRIKARVLGIQAEDYYSDKVLDDAKLLYSGVQALPADFWEQHGNDMACWQENSRTYYKLSGPLAGNCHPNECVYQDNEQQFEAIVRRIEQGNAIIEKAVDYRTTRHHSPKSRAKLCPQSIDGSEYRLRLIIGDRRYRQDLVGSRCRPGPNLGDAALPRNHHDPRDGTPGRGHRFSSGHRGRKDDPVDGRSA
jgi:PhoH-like ATPase